MARKMSQVTIKQSRWIDSRNRTTAKLTGKNSERQRQRQRIQYQRIGQSPKAKEDGGIGAGLSELKGRARW